MVCNLPPTDKALAEKVRKEKATQEFLELAGLVGEMGKEKLNILKLLVDSIDKKDLERISRDYDLEVDKN